MKKPPDLLPLTPPVFHILLALADEERHGYGIMQDVARQTNDALQLGPGTLYGCLKRMLAAGLVDPQGRVVAQAQVPTPDTDDAETLYAALLFLVGEITATAEDPPLRLVLGADAVARIEDKLKQVASDIAAWRELSRSTDIQD